MTGGFVGAGSIRFGADSRALACAFLPDGSALCTGSSDGFVEVWDTVTCRLRTDLAYQAQDELMMHDDPVLALAPSDLTHPSVLSFFKNDE